MQVKHTPSGAADWKVYTRDSRSADAADTPHRAAADSPAPGERAGDTVSLSSGRSSTVRPSDIPQVVRYTFGDAAGGRPSDQLPAETAERVAPPDGIADVDGARKVATYVKNQIMANAGQAVQAQASNFPATALPLTRV